MNSKRMIQTALLVALAAVATMVVNIPLPGVKGYVNVGDAIVFLAGLMFGPVVGAISGAFGSALADLLLGYAHWAPWTFFIKGAEGFFAGWLAWKGRKAEAGGVLLGALVMVMGYFLVGILYYGWAPALTSVPGDLLQGGVSMLLALVLVNPLRKYLKLKK